MRYPRWSRLILLSLPWPEGQPSTSHPTTEMSEPDDEAMVKPLPALSTGTDRWPGVPAGDIRDTRTTDPAVTEGALTLTLPATRVDFPHCMEGRSPSWPAIAVRTSEMALCASTCPVWPGAAVSGGIVTVRLLPASRGRPQRREHPGGPGAIRTRGLPLRRRSLYPA